MRSLAETSERRLGAGEADAKATRLGVDLIAGDARMEEGEWPRGGDLTGVDGAGKGRICVGVDGLYKDRFEAFFRKDPKRDCFSGFFGAGGVCGGAPPFFDG